MKEEGMKREEGRRGKKRKERRKEERKEEERKRNEGNRGKRKRKKGRKKIYGSLSLCMSGKAARVWCDAKRSGKLICDKRRDFMLPL
jgi:hypothetical protein